MHPHYLSCCHTNKMRSPHNCIWQSTLSFTILYSWISCTIQVRSHRKQISKKTCKNGKSKLKDNHTPSEAQDMTKKHKEYDTTNTHDPFLMITSKNQTVVSWIKKIYLRTWEDSVQTEWNSNFEVNIEHMEGNSTKRLKHLKQNRNTWNEGADELDKNISRHLIKRQQYTVEWISGMKTKVRQ